MFFGKVSKVLTVNLAIFVTLAIALVSMGHSLIQVRKKLEILRRVGKPAVLEQNLALSKIQRDLTWWHKQIDFSIISGGELKLDFSEDKFLSFKERMTTTHAQIKFYMTEWGVDVNDALRFYKVSVLFSSNTIGILEKARLENADKLYLKRQLSDYGSSLNFYEQSLDQKHQEILIKAHEERDLRNGLYITICGIIITLCFFSLVLVRQFLSTREESRSKKYNILFVDDDAEILEVLTSANEKLMHCRFFQAGDGLEALSIVAVHEIDLIITDLSMPNMDGLELIKELEIKNIPYIVMTSKVLLSEKVRKQLKGQHVFDKFDLLYRMDEIIGAQIKFSSPDDDFDDVS